MTVSSKGIVVLGFPRSGTTLLRRLLNSHSNIACPGETCLLSGCARFLQTEIVADGLEFGVLNGLEFAGINSGETLQRLRDFAFSFFQQHADAEGKNRWAEKTAIDIFHLEKIEALCRDEVQYVCIVRHGLDVACSVQEFSERGYGYLTEIHEYVQRYSRPMEAFAHAWVDTNSALHKFVESQQGNAILFRYEDLVSEPGRRSQELFDFIGEKWEQELNEVASEKMVATGLGDWKTYQRAKIDDSSIGRWKRLPRFIAGRLAEICNPTLSLYGYEPVSIKARNNQASARRKYELALHLDADSSDKKS